MFRLNPDVEEVKGSLSPMREEMFTTLTENDEAEIPDISDEVHY